MAAEQRQDAKPPRDVGHVPIEVVGVDDVSRGGRPSQPPSSDLSRALAAGGYILVPIAIGVFFTSYGSETFVRAHALQSVALWVLIVGLFVLPCTGTVLSLAGVAVAVFAAYRAYQGEYIQLPGIWQVVRRFM